MVYFDYRKKYFDTLQFSKKYVNAIRVNDRAWFNRVIKPLFPMWIKRLIKNYTEH